MAKNKNIPIKYTSRDFESIKNDLIEHAKRYYPDNYNDFSEASFGSLMFDSVSYIGDVLSYYLDYAVNESFIDTAVEFSNVRRHAKNNGYNYAGVPVSSGILTFFILVPSTQSGLAPDLSYAPILKKGSEFLSNSNITYTLTEDVDFSDPANDKVAAKTNSNTGITSHFAIRAYGQVVSGKSYQSVVDLTNDTFEKFKRIRVGDNTITEIIDVVDSEGNRYYEVDFLSQEVVYIETTNPSAFTDGVRSIMKPFVTARRFIIDQDNSGTYMQFGFGSDSDDDTGLADPSTVSMQMFGKDYVTNKSFDPTKLLNTDKLGISPQGTTLNITYRRNDGTVVNAGARTINNIGTVNFRFKNESVLNNSLTNDVIESIEVTNDEPIVGSSVDFTIDELRTRSKNYFATQNRAVTKLDYESIAYNMPTKFGKIKRINAVNNPFATNKELILYVVSVDENGNLVQTNMRTKQNLKTWLNQYNSINDVVRIDDAKIVNFRIDFSILTDNRYETSGVLSNAVERVRKLYSDKLYVGEPIYLNDIRNILSKTEGVVDINTVSVSNVSSTDGNYSAIQIDFDRELKSNDGTYYKAPKNVVFELKNPEENVKGIAT